MTPTLLSDRICTFWRLNGLRGALDAVRPRIASRKEFVRFEIDLSTWEPRHVPAGVEVRRGLDELERVRRNRSDLPTEFYLDRVRAARRPYLGFFDGQIGHISWLFTPSDRPRLIALGDGEVELDGAFTLPEARGRGLLTAVECAILLDARREGYTTAYTHVAVDNVASLRGVRKTGFLPAGVVTLRWTLGVARTTFVVQLAAEMLA